MILETAASVASVVSIIIGVGSMIQAHYYFRKSVQVRDEISRLLDDLDRRVGEAARQAQSTFDLTAPGLGIR